MTSIKKYAIKFIAVCSLLVTAAAVYSQVTGNVPRPIPAPTVTSITGSMPVVVTPTGTVFDIKLQPCAVGQALIWQATPLPVGYKCTTPTAAPQTEWFTTGTAIDAGADKVGSIARTGNVVIGGNVPSLAKLEVNGDISLPNNTGAKAIYTWTPTDSNWRIGMGVATGFTKSITPSHTQFLSYSNGGGQGFAIGVNGGSSSFEVEGSTHKAFFRGNVGIGTTSPTTTLQVNSSVVNDSGLRLEQTKQNATQATGIDTVAVGVDATGKVRVTNAIGSADTRAVDSQPQTYAAGSYNEFKQSASIGMGTIAPGVGSYVGLQTFRKYGLNADFSGGQIRQEATTDDGRKLQRMSTSATTWGAWQNTAPDSDFWRDGGKPNTIMTGGGTVTFDNALNLSWTNRFIIIGGGASGTGNPVYSTAGYYDIVKPPVGTVIPSIGNAAPVTVTAAGISMAQWGALYYKLSGGTEASINSNFVYVGYGSGTYTVTSDMVLIAASNKDNNTIRLGTGQVLDAGQSIMPSAAGTQSRADAGLQGNAGARSGFYETTAPAPAANWPVGTSSWQHLLDVRHSNNGNNYAMQFAGSFFDQWFFGRKTNGNAAAAWQVFLMQFANGDIPLKIAPRNYASVAAANADSTLAAGVIYTVTAGGGKALYIK
jgi:hypothetical protein